VFVVGLALFELVTCLPLLSLCNGSSISDISDTAQSSIRIDFLESHVGQSPVVPEYQVNS
jgi:hypothetical protein